MTGASGAVEAPVTSHWALGHKFQATFPFGILKHSPSIGNTNLGDKPTKLAQRAVAGNGWDDPDLDAGIHFAVQVNFDRVESEFLQRPFQANLICR